MSKLTKHLNLLIRIDKIDYFVFTVLVIGLIIAISRGYLNADSWLYLHLAQSIAMGEGLKLNEGYFAIFPFGYSILIACTSLFSTDIYQIIIASKIVNFILALISYTFAKKIFKNKLLALFFIINPIYLTIFAWTMSENLFYTAILGVFYYAIKLVDKASVKDSVKLLIFLLIGISSRYFAGTFFFTFFIVYIAVFGFKNIAYKITPFIISGLVFICYQLINKELTGYGSGMPRIPAPESINLLASNFLKTFKEMIIMLVVSYILISFQKLKQLKKNETALDISLISSFEMQQDVKQKKIALLILFSGISYLLSHFFIRSFIQYNDFNIRITGFGVLLLFIGATYYYVKIKDSFKIISLIVFTLFCFNKAEMQNLRQFSLTKFEHPEREKYNYYISFITAFTPRINTEMVDNQSRHDLYTMDRDEYYGYDKNVIFIKSGPYVLPDTLKDVQTKISKIDVSKCAIDFSNIKNRDELSAILYHSTKVDRSPKKYVVDMSQDVIDKLLSIYQPNQLVPCKALLN